YGVAFSRDGRLLASACYDGKVRLWDAKTYRLLRSLEGLAANAISVSFSPDGKRLAATSGLLDLSAIEKPRGMVIVWDTQTGEELLRCQGHQGPCVCAVFSPDGRTLASSSYDMTIRLWDADTGKETKVLRGHAHTVGRLSFS